MSANFGGLMIGFGQSEEICKTNQFPVVSGGSVSTDGDYKVHQFTSAGTAKKIG